MVLELVGAVVTTADSARAAIEALPKARPDVLVSDLGMPHEDGFDLIRQLRDNGYDARDLPAVALTAFFQKDDAHLALLAGFQVHLPKPVDPHELLFALPLAPRLMACFLPGRGAPGLGAVRSVPQRRLLVRARQ